MAKYKIKITTLPAKNETPEEEKKRIQETEKLQEIADEIMEDINFELSGASDVIN